MSITTNINGVDKTISTPSVNIGGTWKTVSVVCNNIDGVWKQSYPDNTYKINLYVYGKLYDTLYCDKGSKITLPSVSTVYEDETAHYGWTTTSGSTSRNYAATASITPTADMNLYAVFSYSVTSAGRISRSSSKTEQSATTGLAGTLTISNCSYSYTRSGGATPKALSLSSDNYVKVAGVSKTLPTGYNLYGTTYGDGGNVSYSVGANVSIVFKSKGQYDTYPANSSAPVTSYKVDSFSISYPAYVTTVKYRSTIT